MNRVIFVVSITADYRCKNGKVNIIVGKGQRNAEVVCDKAGQNISIALHEGEFLHMGAIICPGCIEICGEDNCSPHENLNSDENLTVVERKEKSVRNESSDRENDSLQSTVVTDIPDAKVGVKDELDCGGGGFFDDFFDYFD